MQCNVISNYHLLYMREVEQTQHAHSTLHSSTRFYIAHRCTSQQAHCAFSAVRKCSAEHVMRLTCYSNVAIGAMTMRRPRCDLDRLAIARTRHKG